MGKGGPSDTAERTTLSIPPAVREAPRHPEYLGLPRNASKARVFQELLTRAWAATLAERSAREELALYAAYEADPERRTAARDIQDMTLRSGVV